MEKEKILKICHILNQFFLASICFLFTTDWRERLGFYIGLFFVLIYFSLVVGIFFIAHFSPHLRDRRKTVFRFFISFVILISLSWGVGIGINSLKWREMKRKAEDMAVILEKFHEIKGYYPANFRELKFWICSLGISKFNDLNISYIKRKNEALLMLKDPREGFFLRGFYIYSSLSKKWEYKENI